MCERRGRKGFMSEYSDQTRKLFKEGDDIRDAGLVTPKDIVRCDDIPYGADPAQQSLDVYRPKDAEGKKLPVIVSVHGGGWVYGDKERYQYYCMSLAQRGFAVVNFTYRLAPENKFPACLEDTVLVFQWVLDHSGEYGFDTDRVFGVGDSAGGHILGLFCNLCTNPQFAEKFSFRAPAGFVPTAVALNCGVYRIGQAGAQDLSAGVLPDLLPEKGSAKEMDMLCVTDHVTSAFPPAFVMTATGDFLKDQATLLAARLMEKNVPFVCRLYGTEEHKLYHVFHCDMRSEDGRKCNDDECDFFKTFCV